MRLIPALLATLVLSLGHVTAQAQSAASAPQAQAALVDINRASLDELKALKGIGEVRAAAIVKGRPFARKDDLVRKGIVPDSVYQDIKESIIAKQ